ncbi:MAG: hypothetical protein ACXADB_07585 [Candidatus Hermodarchaeia archaeon]|jgi:hypothetical protein
MVTRTIERKVKIVTIQTRRNRIIIQFSPVAFASGHSVETPRMPRLEDVIVKEPETEEERIAMRIARAYMNELQKVMASYRPPLPSQRPSSRTPLQIEFTAEDYEKLGKPTVNEHLVLKLEYEKSD